MTLNGLFWILFIGGSIFAYIFKKNKKTATTFIFIAAIGLLGLILR